MRRSIAPAPAVVPGYGMLKDGIVTIHGTPETAAVGYDLIDAIRHAEGVVAVRDRLSDPDDPTYRTRVTEVSAD